MDFYQRACELKNDTIANRRYIHENAEVGLDLPKTVAFVKQKLEEYGLEPVECGKGLTCTLGNGGKCIMLRADMDALPMTEESGESFACKTGSAHACGHDLHTSMLLTAARMLKETEHNLEGCVKFMFQPAEEICQGAKNMVNVGILENPKVDATLAYHVVSNQMPVGAYMYNDNAAIMHSADAFRIEVQGHGAHGAYPNLSVDPINVLVHIYVALEAILAREVDPTKTCVMSVGKILAGTAMNAIPDDGFMEGSIRTDDAGVRELVVKRMKEVSTKVAEAFHAKATVTMLCEVPPLICDPELTKNIASYMFDMDIEGTQACPGFSVLASEDFAVVSERVPSTFMFLSAGFTDERGRYAPHNPKVRFNEDVCPIGSAYLANCAARWLHDNG